MADVPIPSAAVPVVDPATGLMDPAWYQFFSDSTRLLGEATDFLNGIPNTGWGAVGGAQDKAAWNTGTITLTPLAQRVGALIETLRSQGILGS